MLRRFHYRIWTGATSGSDLVARVMALPGFGKQLGVRPEGWQQAVGDYSLEGYRSVADVVDEASLAKVRAYKKEKKAAARTARA